ncbi:Hypothetical_protein [Hexamita inflata]|uniref:Hypothetical_protein n=1 Tax=Hexamita inflata TaxID=28002 RepID=A0AA86Q4T7_9EUKA|nr:Hypothetical protein HINF_LOCUS40024 [Hexamita inflata]
MLNSAYTQHSQGETCHTQGQRLVQMQFNSKQVSCVLYKQSNRSQITLKQFVCSCKVSQEMNVYQYNVIIYIVNAAQLTASVSNCPSSDFPGIRSASFCVPQLSWSSARFLYKRTKQRYQTTSGVHCEREMVN